MLLGEAAWVTLPLVSALWTVPGVCHVVTFESHPATGPLGSNKFAACRTGLSFGMNIVLLGFVAVEEIRSSHLPSAIYTWDMGNLFRSLYTRKVTFWVGGSLGSLSPNKKCSPGPPFLVQPIDGFVFGKAWRASQKLPVEKSIISEGMQCHKAPIRP